MNRSLSDLVTDARLESEVHADHTIHALSISDPTAGHRLQKYQQRWNREKLLGSGGFGTVWLERCVDGGVLNGSLRAVKEIKRDATGVSSIDYSRELEAIAKFSQKPRQSGSGDPWISWHVLIRTCMHSTVTASSARMAGMKTRNPFFVAMEYIGGGDLQRYLDNSQFSEQEAVIISRQLLEGLAFMHENGFAHRDIKPQNILVQRPRPSWWVKIADFGISKRVQELSKLTTVVGTQAYMAPELKGIFSLEDMNRQDKTTYTFAVDIWSLGIIAARMVTNAQLFNTPQELFSYVVMSSPLTVAEDANPSHLCEDFLAQTLAASPGKRLSSQDALAHPWISSHDSIQDVPYVPSKSTDLHWIAGLEDKYESATSSSIPQPSAAWTDVSDTWVASPRLPSGTNESIGSDNTLPVQTQIRAEERREGPAKPQMLISPRGGRIAYGSDTTLPAQTQIRAEEMGETSEDARMPALPRKKRLVSLSSSLGSEYHVRTSMIYQALRAKNVIYGADGETIVCLLFIQHRTSGNEPIHACIWIWNIVLGSAKALHSDRDWGAVSVFEISSDGKHTVVIGESNHDKGDTHLALFDILNGRVVEKTFKEKDGMRPVGAAFASHGLWILQVQSSAVKDWWKWELAALDWELQPVSSIQSSVGMAEQYATFTLSPDANSVIHSKLVTPPKYDDGTKTRLIDLATDSIIWSHDGKELSWAIFTGDNQRVAFLKESSKRSFQLKDARTGETLKDFRAPEYCQREDISLSRTGEHIAVLGQIGHDPVIIHSQVTRRSFLGKTSRGWVKSEISLDHGYESVRGIALSPDGRIVASLSFGKKNISGDWYPPGLVFLRRTEEIPRPEESLRSGVSRT